MTEEEMQDRHRNLLAWAQEAVDRALERHRKLGESIAIWQDGKVVILKAEEIPLPSATLESR
jgi:hypothetical protein